MPSKSVLVQYRYLLSEGLGDEYNLRDVISDVLQRSGGGGGRPLAQLVGSRRKDIDQDGSYVVLNKFAITGQGRTAVFCGELLYIRATKEVPGIMQSIDDDLPDLDIATLTLGEQNSLVDGILYFAIVDNHVALIEGQRARGRTLERYLTALLQDADELQIGQPIILNPRIEGLKAESVSKVTFRPPRAMAPGEAMEEERSIDAGSRAARDKTVMDVLAAIGMGADEIESLKQSIPPGGWIEGLFTMMFKQKGNKKNTVSREQLETAFRNLNDRDIGLFEPGGSAEKRGHMKLSERRNVETVGPLLDREAAMQAIVSMLRLWASSGKIDLTF